jgi:pimeloyl-ACP methyl ester carboxylesterase
MTSLSPSSEKTTTNSLPERFSQYTDLRIAPDSVLPISENSWWVSLAPSPDFDSGALEGKFHLPQERATRLVIFEPGFPGGASTDFERLHLKGLLAAGYAVFTTRHRGTIINGKYSDYYINCPSRQEKARRENQEILGSGQHTVGDWLVEPLIALSSLGGAFEEVILAGISFGGLAVVTCATTIFKDKLKHHGKIKKVVSLAGVGGRLRSDKDHFIERWHEFIRADWAADRVEIGEPEPNIECIRKAHQQLHKFAEVIPQSVGIVCLTACGDTEDSVDELLPAQEALDVIVSAGHGTLVVDKTQRADPQGGKLAHELEFLKTDDLLKFVDPAWRPAKQILRLDEHGLS